MRSHLQLTFRSRATRSNKKMTPCWMWRNCRRIHAGVRPTSAMAGLSCSTTTITNLIYSKSFLFIHYAACSRPKHKMLEALIWLRKAAPTPAQSAGVQHPLSSRAPLGGQRLVPTCRELCEITGYWSPCSLRICCLPERAEN